MEWVPCCKERELNIIDFVKVISMLLVVAGHACTIYTGSAWGGIVANQSCTSLGMLNKWLATFHTQLFAFASGYLFCMIRYEKGRYRAKKDIFKRARRLLLPYICFSLLWAIPFGIRFENLSIYSIVRNYMLAISPAQLWFLIMLFGVFCVFYFFSDKIMRYNHILMSLLAVLIFCSASVLSRYLPINLFQIKSIIKYSLYYYFGMLLRKGEISIPSPKCVPIIILLEIIFSYGYLICSNNNVILKIVLEPIVGLNGIILMLSVANVFNVEKIKKNAAFMLFEKCSMGVYLIHQQIMYVFLYYSNKSDFSPYFLFFFNFIAVLSISVVLTVLLQKFKLGRYLLGLKIYN